MEITIRTALASASALLLNSTSARLDAEVLLAHSWGQSRSYLFAHPESPIPALILQRFTAGVQQRQQGVPIAYITGQCEFWSLSLAVTPATLIPRPETELLVEQALVYVRSGCRILDLGTGSGAIALALATECPDCQIVAVDQSPAALAVAACNIQALALTHVHLLCSDWFAALPPSFFAGFDLIVANPPYISPNDPHLQQGDVRFEPKTALTAAEDGLQAIRLIIQQAPRFLRPKGYLLLEHGYNQAQAVQHLLQEQGYGAIQHHLDLSGWIRVTQGQLKDY